MESHQAEFPIVGLQYDDADFVGRTLRGQTQYFAQIGQRQRAVAAAEYRGGMDVFDAGASGVAFQPNQLVEADLGNHKPFPAGGDHQSRDNRQSERDLHPYGSAVARMADQVHRTPDPLDMGLHNIHAHPTARNIGHRLRGGKTGQKYEVDGVALGQPLRLFSAYQSPLHGFGLHALGIDTGSVIGDFEIHLAAFMECMERQPALGRFAAGHAVLGALDTVVAGVAHDMRERILDRLDDGPVQFRDPYPA